MKIDVKITYSKTAKTILVLGFRQLPNFATGKRETKIVISYLNNIAN